MSVDGRTTGELAWTLVRVLLALAAVASLLLTPVVVVTGETRRYDPFGIAVDFVALVIVLGVVLSFVRGRRRTGP